MLRDTSPLYQSDTAGTGTRVIPYALGTTMLLCAGLRVRHSPGAIEDACEQVDLPGDAPWALAPDVGEEHGHRGFADGHGMVLDRENPHLRWK